MNLKIHDNVTNEILARIEQFQQEAKDFGLAEIARERLNDMPNIELSIRQRFGFRLMRWGLRMSGKAGNWSEVVATLQANRQ